MRVFRMQFPKLKPGGIVYSCSGNVADGDSEGFLEVWKASLGVSDLFLGSCNVILRDSEVSLPRWDSAITAASERGSGPL